MVIRLLKRKNGVTDGEKGFQLINMPIREVLSLKRRNCRVIKRLYTDNSSWSDVLFDKRQKLMHLILRQKLQYIA